jgi:predicted DNA-binding transcriptional regulator AlpA
MFTPEELEAAARLLVNLRGLTAQPAQPQPLFVRSGKPLAKVLGVENRGKAWALSHEPDFPTPYVLGPKTILYNVAEVLAWMETRRAARPLTVPPMPAEARVRLGERASAAAPEAEAAPANPARGGSHGRAAKPHAP